MSVPESFAGVAWGGADAAEVSTRSLALAAQPPNWLSPEGIDILPVDEPRTSRAWTP